MDHSKRKNIYIIVFVVTTIIAACVAVYFGIKVNEGKGDLQIANKDIEEYKAKLEQAKANVSQGEVNVPKTEEKVVEKIVEKSTPVAFNKDKCLNGDKGVTYEYDLGDGSTASIINSFYLENGVPKIILGTDATEQFKNNKIQTNMLVTIKGFSSKVVDICARGLANSVGEMVLLFLMEDGTVEYIPFAKAIESGNLNSYGKVPNVSSIIKFYEGRTIYAEGGGSFDVFAVNNKGEFYSMRASLLKFL